MVTIYYARSIDGALVFQLEDTIAVMRYYYHSVRDAYRLFKEKYGISRAKLIKGKCLPFGMGVYA